MSALYLLRHTARWYTPLLAATAVAALALVPPPAYAGNGYEKVTSTFGEPCKTTPCPAGQFKEPTSIAINDETEDVYVLDKGDDRVEWFNAKGVKFEGQFNGSGENLAVEHEAAPTGKLLEPEGIAIDNDPLSPSHGDVYVADQGHDVIDKFSATGEYQGQFTGGRCENGGETPPCAGSKLIPFNRSLDVGVDASGDLWVYETEQPNSDLEGEAYAFSASASFIEGFKTEEWTTNEAPGFAVDTNGNLYTSAEAGIDEFERPTGNRTVIEEGASPLATLADIFSTGNLLVDEGSSIELFKAPVVAGALPVSVFPSEGLSGSGGIAVNGAKGEGTIYATERVADDVDVLESEAAKAPVVVSESASTVGPEAPEAKFAAVINPENRTTTYTFEYAASEAELLNEEGTKLPGEAGLPAEFGGQTATSSVVELRPINETFYYRVVAENEESKGKPTVGKVETYTKLPLVENEKTIGLTSTSAELEATVNSIFQNTDYTLEYANRAALLGTPEATVISLPEKENGTPESVTTEVTGLQPGETYYYRVVAVNPVTLHTKNINAGEPVRGKIEEVTPYAPPAVTTGGAQGITGTAAALSGTVDPEGTEATYHFVYINNVGYEKAVNGDPQEKANPYAEGETTATFSLPASSSPQPVGPILAPDLLPGEKYHYALVAVNRFELRTTGKDETLTTQPPTPPNATTGTATAITQTTATLTGTLTTNGLQTSYSFEIATEPGNYGTPTSIGSTEEVTEDVTATLTNLQPDTTYYYRLTATNNDGTTPGAPQAFTTLSLPYLLATPPTLTLTFPANDLPTQEPTTHPKSKPLTNKQKLNKALKACHKLKNKTKRQHCEHTAKNKYKTTTKKHHTTTH